MYSKANRFVYATYYRHLPDSNEKSYFYWQATMKTDNETEVVVPQMFQQFADYVLTLDEAEKNSILNEIHVHYPILLKYFIKGE